MENLPTGPTLRKITQDEWVTIAAECHEQMVALGLNQNMTAIDRHFIYPGTKWCGLGDVADDFDDIGRHETADKCCREHDHCHDYMSPGTCKYGLCNHSIFTKSHCDCDDKFRQCLLNAMNDKASMSVGFIFFSVSALSCYRQSPDCRNTFSRHSRRRGRHYRTSGMASSTDWCFVRPQRRPFKKPN
ncbi:phospholipase A2-like isoform X2 [Daphnia pulex]|nr:phospholipase A2-like isoform X2 [Daphnia pulex]